MISRIAWMVAISLLVALQGCASTGASDVPDQLAKPTSFSPATTNESYMFRSPPAGFTSGVPRGR